MSQPVADIGMVGLGTMGGNLALNLADHGYVVAGLDHGGEKLARLHAQAPAGRVVGGTDARAFVAQLKPPRAIIILVPAGRPVDDVIGQLSPLLSAGDLLIDAGNSHFRDTNRRAELLSDRRLHFFGMGVSGGEQGARRGPSLMPGGPRDAYERIRPVLDAVAAKVRDESCVDWLGHGSAGHYVKMVHNGIEYGLMQLIAESYDVLRRLGGLSNADLARTFAAWNRGALQGFLVEITAEVFRQVDPETGRDLIDMILDVAHQKGTGQWTSQEALELRVPTPSIDVAVTMRVLSSRREVRKAAGQLYGAGSPGPRPAGAGIADQVCNALYAATVLTYGQGMSLLRAASDAYGYELRLERVARIWRGGCIIRSVLLEDICAAYQRDAALADLTLDPALCKRLTGCLTDLRAVVRLGVESGLPVMGLGAALHYLDSLRAAGLPLNLVQAQRDYFGAHSYERVDKPGTFHTHWGQ